MPDWKEEITRRLASLKLAPAREAEIVEEVAQHLDDRYQELVSGGATESEARRVALEELSEEDLLARGLRRVEQEVTQEPLVPAGEGRSNFLASIWQDLRYGLRMLRKNLGFTVITVATLALGIGANTTIFNFTNALLLRPPAVESPTRLVEVWDRNVKASSAFEAYMPFSFLEYAYYRDHNHVFSDLIAFDADPASISWNRAGQGELVQGQFVSGNFFSALGVRPALGRSFVPEEDKVPGTHPVVVLSHRFWQQRFGGDRGVLGKELTLNGTVFTVAGVAPAGFSGMIVGLSPDFWMPIMMDPLVKHYPQLLENWGSHEFLAIGKLNPGATRDEAKAEMSLLARQLEKAHPANNKDIDADVFPATMIPGPFRGYVGAFTGLLQVVVAFVLMIACANAANLFLVQSTARRHEVAIRSALGASRWRLIRQTLSESLLVAALAGAAGFSLAQWTAPLLLRFTPPTLPIRLEVTSDWRVLVFTITLSLLAGIVLGLAPALQGTKFGLITTLKETTRSGSYRRSRLRSTLVVAQVAICLVLLIGGGLCLRSLLNAQSIDPGFSVEKRLIATLNLKSLDYPEARGRTFYDTLTERVKGLPGVVSASVASYLPLEGDYMGLEVNVQGRQPPPGQGGFGVQFFDVGPGFFRTMGTPLLRGREFNERDRQGAPLVAVINDAMANRFWPDQDAVGQRLIIGDEKSGEQYEVIGVVRGGKYRTLGEQPHPVLFRSFLQQYHPKATLVVQTAGSPASLLVEVHAQVSKLDPNLALIQLGSLQEHLAFALFPARVTGILLGVIGSLGLLLAVVGLSGMIAYSVAQRTNEIGVRMALGAQRRDVLRLVVSDGARLSLCGIAIGLLASFGLTRFLSSLLYGISPTDPTTFAVVSLLLFMVGVLASYVPARRATKVDPIVALRYE
jgi:predicted permease